MTPDSREDRQAPAPADARRSGEPTPGQRFTRIEHLRRRPDFVAAYEQGTRLSGSLMTMFFRHNALGQARLGIAATRKIGSAVERNRAKRRVRDLYRRHKLIGGIDVVVIPRRTLIDAPADRLEAEFCALLKRGARIRA